MAKMAMMMKRRGADREKAGSTEGLLIEAEKALPGRL